jgi:hypothetical protein
MGSQSIRNLDANSWFGPLQPIRPSAPTSYRPRQYAYTPGANLLWQPKGDSPIQFATLRGLADAYDLLRMAIERKKDQICGVNYQIRAKEVPGETTKDYKARSQDDKTLKELTRFFVKPDGFHRWRPWLRMWVEDLLVIDAVALNLSRDKQGRVAVIEPIAGDTIGRLLTDQGRTPPPPSVAYQQVVYGTPAWDFTTDDLVYAMSNERTDRRYGYSRVERCLMTISFGLRRQEWQISEYTSGNIPEALVFLPSDLPLDRIKEAQDWFDSILAGDLQNRRRLRFLPGYGSGDQAKPNVIFPKLPLLKDDLDVWLAQLICFNFGISAQPFLKMMNRASAEESNDAATQEGLKPDVDFVIDTLNGTLDRMGLGDDYEFAAQPHLDVDPLKAAQADNLLIGKKYTVNESRERTGDDPSPEKNANRLGMFTQKGFVPLDADPEEEDDAPPTDPKDPKDPKDKKPPKDEKRPA